MDNANKMACELLVYPNNAKYDEDIRQFQGCPTIAVTQKGRIFVAWYSGGTGEPDMENYNLMIYSDDNGKSWSKPVLVIPSNKERFIHALDIQLWISPQGKLYVFWVQNNTELEPAVRPEKQAGKPLLFKDGYMFNDFRHAE